MLHSKLVVHSCWKRLAPNANCVQQNSSSSWRSRLRAEQRWRWCSRPFPALRCITLENCWTMRTLPLLPKQPTGSHGTNCFRFSHTAPSLNTGMCACSLPFPLLLEVCVLLLHLQPASPTNSEHPVIVALAGRARPPSLLWTRQRR